MSRSVKKEVKRIGHKSARQAEKESLRGRLPDTVHGMHYSSRLPQPHLPDNAVTGGPRRYKKNKSKWCKGHVGVEHNYVWKKSGHWRNTGWICERCTKRHWGTPKGKTPWWEVRSDPSNDHWSYHNIWRRLNGYDCDCDNCSTPTS